MITNNNIRKYEIIQNNNKLIIKIKDNMKSGGLVNNLVNRLLLFIKFDLIMVIVALSYKFIYY